ncbi:alkaline phosphatase [Streptomyces sp. MST-110588]|uniref:alkaline phosphatase n=1 Tax=Streptomyces sp. MST-110588 TaxID=2833628 RepID=UPI001F5CA4B2|nr:alkaline phosphatase [Streptomyces sp. MST-110588]UNO41109.1 alkaline phosphatase [Streptomyces sp. MST-110588]
MRRVRLSRRHVIACATVVLATAVAVPAGASAFGTQEQVEHAVKGGPAKNVILLIGDGMGDSEITLARDYTVGAAGRLNMDRLPMTGAYTTYSVDEKGKPDYVTDSAASGSGWATGHKTVNGRISKTPGTNKALPTILELAQKNGYATGSVTTAELTDATPAVLASHATDRSCQGPADMAKCAVDTIGKGGPGSIAEQSVNHKVDVLLGGGKQRFDQKITEGRYKGMTVLQQASKLGYQVVTDAKGLKGVKSVKGGKPVLGLFAPGNVPVEWTGKPAAVGGTDPQRCTTSNSKRPAGTPALDEQAKKAIALLEDKQRARSSKGHGGKGSDKGFFLQIEGASIDKQDHAADPCGQIGETAAFDRAVKVARDYAAKHPDTLVVTTADHGHSSQIVPLEANPPGLSSTLVTNEGSRLKVNYSTNTPGQSQEHTGTEVRIAAQGPQAFRVLGVTDQTDLFRTIRTALRLR